MLLYQPIKSLFDTTRETFTTILLKSISGSLFIALCTQIAIPFWPIPMTMQDFAVLVIGLLCSPLVAMTSVLSYLIEGAMGLPVFSNPTGGLAHLGGTTGGFLIGFLPLAILPSLMQEWSRNSFLRQFISCIVGQIGLYIFGLSWLSTFVGVHSAIQLGLMPFILKIPFICLLAIVTVQIIETAREKNTP